MKVIYVSSGLTHYYNLVLSKLNREPGIELVAIVPRERSTFIGEGVYQTREGANFRIIELEETHKLGLYTSFKGLAGILRREKPDAIIVSEDHLRAFLFDLPVVIARKRIRAALILKSIPFRNISYLDASASIKDTKGGFASLPSVMNVILQNTGLMRLAKRCALFVRKLALNLPDAHVNYVEAYEYWESYGISREKIFITRNSPDTDLLFSVKGALADMPPIMPQNPYRLLHVGRLVAWKRVDMLMRAFTRVRERFPTAELLIIGAGPEEEALKKLGNDLQLGASVTFTGGVYDPYLLGRYYKASALYVLAGMGGLSINEAMCFNLPVLCSVCDGTEKILVREGVNGRYFRDGDEDDLVDKITWFFEHADQLPQMGSKSVEIIRNEVNIRTVIDGYMKALQYVQRIDTRFVENKVSSISRS